ncbi:MAG: sulfurtransferase [Deltaproteobacteria bacterium]|nr:sulfurtransferase [Deltaproteobacteria bacterium]
MRLNNILKPAQIMTEAEAKEFMNKHKSDEYQLVDVRLHEEYEDDHLPGAMLVPLPELTVNQHTLDPNKPTIVYCRSGGRSRAAAQFLNGQGFNEVYDISSHIMEWMGVKAYGEYDFNLDIIPQDVEFKDAWTLAYAMEEGLQNFYYALEKQEERPELKKVYNELAAFEDMHKDRLAQQYAKEMDGKIDQEKIKQLSKEHLEGGDINEISPITVISKIDSVLDVFGFSMAIEAQALDLYSRLSRNSENEQVAQLFLAMADEEKEHMNYVKKEMEKHLSSKVA